MLSQHMSALSTTFASAAVATDTIFNLLLEGLTCCPEIIALQGKTVFLAVLLHNACMAYPYHLVMSTKSRLTGQASQQHGQSPFGCTLCFICRWPQRYGGSTQSQWVLPSYIYCGSGHLQPVLVLVPSILLPHPDAAAYGPARTQLRPADAKAPGKLVVCLTCKACLHAFLSHCAARLHVKLGAVTHACLQYICILQQTLFGQGSLMTVAVSV